MKYRRCGAWLSVVALLSACGGGGSGSGNPPSTGPIGSPAPTPSPSPTGTCSLRARQDWVAAQLREWYLFPETLPANLDPTPFTSVEAYLDALTATARAQRRDRFFTYITSIAEENAFFNSGSTAGFGIRLSYDTPGRRLFVAEAYEGAPALAAGIDRGAEIVAIGTTTANLRTVSDIFAAEGAQGVSNALGPSTAGTSRVLRVTDASGTRTLTVAKADYELLPVSPRYGARILDDGGRRVGYVNLRTFINTADPALRNAFASFRAQNIGEVIVDFRYNGGGLVSIADLTGDLLGGNRNPAEVFSRTLFRPEKSSNNSTRNFKPQPQSVASTKVAFIGTGATASASELVINSFIPYLRANAALVGSNTFGKPVGQIALDRPECDDRLRVVAFKTVNAAGQGDYFDGLAGTVEASCQAGDDLGRQLGDPQEASTRASLDFIAGRSCTKISSGISTQAARPSEPRLEPLVPNRPSAAQRELPGLY
jgi:C-terminal processing protease CtpA/Prc